MTLTETLRPFIGQIVTVRGAPGGGMPHRSTVHCRAEVLDIEVRPLRRGAVRARLGEPYCGWVTSARCLEILAAMKDRR